MCGSEITNCWFVVRGGSERKETTEITCELLSNKSCIQWLRLSAVKVYVGVKERKCRSSSNSRRFECNRGEEGDGLSVISNIYKWFLKYTHTHMCVGVRGVAVVPQVKD